MARRAAGISCSGFVLLVGLLASSAPLRAVCGPNGTQTDITCFGLYSLAGATTGVSNTAIGKNSMHSNLSGGGNTALGDASLYHNDTGDENVAIGEGALQDNVAGNHNVAMGAAALLSNTADGGTAIGYYALFHNTTGAYDTATGFQALSTNTTGGYNTAAGYQAMLANTSGGYNVAVGVSSLATSTTGVENTAVGPGAMMQSVSGYNNVAVGLLAGAAYTGAESYNVAVSSFGVAGDSGVIRIGSIGNQNKAFVAGIYGVNASSGIPVYVSSSGQLGTATSSLRFKEDVADLGEASDELMRLRPVTFHYKAQYDDGQHLLQYGLIAEEVAAVDPGLVQYGDDGQPLTVRYHFVNALLLGEVQKQHATISTQVARLDRQATEIDSLQSTVASQNSTIAALAERLGKLEAAAAPPQGSTPKS